MRSHLKIILAIFSEGHIFLQFSTVGMEIIQFCENKPHLVEEKHAGYASQGKFKHGILNFFHPPSP
jgi:hypothetical protein